MQLILVETEIYDLIMDEACQLLTRSIMRRQLQQQNAMLAQQSHVLEQQNHELEARRQMEEQTAELEQQAGELSMINRVLQDEIERRKMIEAQLAHQAFHDTLTELPNRTLFTDRLTQAVERAKRWPDYKFAVLFLDLDSFKTVNDSLGHQIGDELLRVVARQLQDCVRPGDTVARLGGDEFTILLDGVQNLDDPKQVAERIQTAIRRPINLEGHRVTTSASIGIAVCTGQHEAGELLRNADIAMYRAKTEGKDRYVIFQTNSNE